MEILQNYNINDILIIIFVVAAAVYAVWQATTNINEHIHEMFAEKAGELEEQKKLTQLLESMDAKLNALDVLLESDKSRIKGEIYKAFLRCSDAGCITAKELEYLEQQYHCYHEEGGNSYIDSLMEQLRGMLKN